MGEIKTSKGKDQKLIGFQDCIQELMQDINQDTHVRDVITLIGMPGVGKTAVATKIFHDPSICQKFTTRIWIDASKDLNIYSTILNMVSKSEVSIISKSGYNLKDEVMQNLERVTFLMVLDDVPSVQAWQHIERVLPQDNKSKVLITSREDTVASVAYPLKKPHRLRLLTNEES